jgi:hypothetical protein
MRSQPGRPAALTLYGFALCPTRPRLSRSANSHRGRQDQGADRANVSRDLGAARPGRRWGTPSAPIRRRRRAYSPVGGVRGLPRCDPDRRQGNPTCAHFDRTGDPRRSHDRGAKGRRVRRSLAAAPSTRPGIGGPCAACVGIAHSTFRNGGDRRIEGERVFGLVCAKGVQVR